MNAETTDFTEDSPILSNNEKNIFKKQIENVNIKVIKKLIKVSLFCTSFMIIEFIGGYLAHSLAVMTDAAHLLSDLSGFIISMLSLYIALRPANYSLTYGYQRAEVIGALISICLIWCLTAWLIVEAFDRIYNPRKIDGIVMISISFCGLMFNLVMSKILSSEEIPNAFEHSDEKHDEINNTVNDKDNPILRAAYIHILGDIIQSMGVLIASILIFIFQENNPKISIIDPICTFIFAVIVLSTSIPISIDCLKVIMEACPGTIDLHEIESQINKCFGVVDIHDLHCWCISVGKPAITMHLLSVNPQKSLEEATKICKSKGIYHITIQVEDKTQRRRDSFIECTHKSDNAIHE